MNKANQAEQFLNYIYKIKIQNPDFQLTNKVIYNQLKYYGLKQTDLEFGKSKNIKETLFSKWVKKFKHSKNITCIHSEACFPYWCQFNNGGLNHGGFKNFIKIYIPLDSEHLYKGAIKIFNFLNKQGIEHTSKIAAELRSDNVVIRLKPDDVDSLNKIATFIHNDKYIQEGMNDTNPFLPTVGKIGVMNDDGGSYNDTIADIISLYINQIVREKRQVNFNEFRNFTIGYLTKYNKGLYAETFKSAYTDIDFQNQNNEKNTLVMSKDEIIKNAIIATFDSHGKKHTIEAVRCALNNDYNMFSRYAKDDIEEETNLRALFHDNISPDELKEYIKNHVNNLNGDLIANFIDDVIYRTKGAIFENALIETSRKHNDTQDYLKKRVYDYMYYGKTTVITSYGNNANQNYNYREQVIKNVEPSQTVSVIESILNSKGIDYSEMIDNEKITCCTQNIIMQYGNGMNY